MKIISIILVIFLSLGACSQKKNKIIGKPETLRGEKYKEGAHAYEKKAPRKFMRFSFMVVIWVACLVYRFFSGRILAQLLLAGQIDFRPKSTLGTDRLATSFILQQLLLQDG